MPTNTTQSTASAGSVQQGTSGGPRAYQTGPIARSGLVRFANDTLTMTRRNLLYLYRQPQVLVFALITPIMFVSLFNYVFGGSLSGTGMTYANFLIPGIMVQTVMFGGGNTAIGLAEDLSRGVVDRFRSLPMSRLAVLTGRTLADSCRGILTNTVIVIIGFIIGFRINNGLGMFLGAFALVLVFGYATTWFFAWMGLKLKTVEAVQAASFLPVFPLTFAASTFAPVENMPRVLRVFANNQPVSIVVDTVRAMMQGGDNIDWLLTKSLLWSLGITLFFGFLSVREYRKG